MQKVLLSFAGFHDPFSRDAGAEQPQPGPVLTVVEEVPFDRVVLLRTVGAFENTDKTAAAISERHPDLDVRIEDLALPDPTDYRAIFRELRRVLRRVTDADSEGDVEYCVALASGTPQMHAAWLLLVASGDLPARILSTRPPKFVTKETPLVSEIDVYSAPFPAVRSYAPYGEEQSPTPDLAEAVREVGIIGEHPALRKAIERARILAPTNYPVLILGETGTGKELLARLIHRLSGRAPDRFVPVNCSAIPRELVESTLFGHLKGAFTGATGNQIGKFDAAHKGTLFLDELCEMPLETQPKLLRALQEGVVEPLGRPQGHKVEVRVVAATNVDIHKAVKDGELREDLYYRLKLAICHLPPLRQRRADIPRLALTFLDRFNTSQNQSKRISKDAMSWLRQQPWPGNIRELQNTVEAAALFAAADAIEVTDLEAAAEGGSSVLDGSIPEPADGFSMPQYLSDLRRRLVDRAMEVADGKQSRAAKLLGISPQALSKHILPKENNES
jgi:DNA-binding NtrC family response regulator